MSEDEEVWARLVQIDQHAPKDHFGDPLPVDPWHLQVEAGESLSKTACGIELKPDVERRDGIDDPHCLACFQVHLARLGLEMDEAPVSEDYEPNSSTIRAETGGVVLDATWQPIRRLHASGTEPLSPIGPIPSSSPIVGRECPACFRPIEAGRYVTMLPLGPGASEEAQAQAQSGGAYNAVAAILHWTCATGQSDEETRAVLEAGDG